MKKWQNKKIIVGNWKMNPISAKRASNLFNSVLPSARLATKVETVVCPPFLYLSELKDLSVGGRIFLGAQDAFYEEEGSYTSEVSAKMLAKLGVRYVILGHSERRALGESSETVALKVKSAVSSGLFPIICIGEKERDQKGDYLQFLQKQLLDSLKGVTAKELSKSIIAYEPIWAIGQNAKRPATADDFLQISIYVRKILNNKYDRLTSRHTPILYGGSVDEKNALDFLSQGEASGLLLGRSSLDAKGFSKIIDIAQNVKN